MQIYNLDEIKKTIEPLALIKSQEAGFVAYSEGRVVVPPVGYLHFEEASGDCHIKYGYIKGDDYFVVKIATGFYKNPDIGLPVGNGIMALFSQRTGNLEALLLDEGYLTDMRTAAAGAVAAKYLAPKKIETIGVVGTGVQARMQLEMLRNVTDCRDVVVWGRDENQRERYKSEMTRQGFSIEPVSRLEQLTVSCNLIVTTTSAREPLLYATEIRPGTHITAVGADASGKQELDPEIFKMADVRVVDSVSQCVDHGDTSYAVQKGLIEKVQLVELGAVIKNPELGRTREDQITVADLTGVAVQDIKIAKLAYECWLTLEDSSSS
jgi:ornithine cyclodeaminase/alanine dehydrogenase-like protein (mu-crystallin family)